MASWNGTIIARKDTADGSYYSVEFIFPDFSGQNESFSLTKLFSQNTNVFNRLQSH